MQAKSDKIVEAEQAWEDYMMEDAEYAFVSYGTSARIVKTAIDGLRKEGYKVGLIRPKTLWPFPEKGFQNLEHIKEYMVVEMSMGQMVNDVIVAADAKDRISFFGRTGGVILTPEEVAEYAKSVMGGEK